MVSFLGILLTLGGATTALFSVIFQVFKTNEPTSVINTFKKSFIKNFWFSTLVYICLLVLGASTYLMVSHAITNQNDIILILGIIASYELIVFTCYFFPTLAIFETNKNSQLIKNVIILSNYHLWTNIKLLGTIVVVAYLIIAIHPIFILVAVGLYAFLVAFHLRPIFKPYIEKLDEEGNH
jgi:uncharacterized membrane protein YesL